MGSGKGGGSDAGPMLEYGDKALKLQERIYDEQRADAQPWYQTGTGAVSQLATLMGIKPQTSATSRQALIDQYKPQFTTQSTTSGSGPMFLQDQYGKIQDLPSGYSDMGAKDQSRFLKNARLKAIGGTAPQTSENVDQQGLNSYIDNLLAQQGAEAESNPLFGTLAKSFGMNDYQEDPGYQFRLQEGNKALERKLNASGKTYSPEAAKALMSYNQDLGSQEYNNAYNRYNINQDNLFNRLATLSGFGQTASGQIANAGANYSNSASDILTGQGNAITAANLAGNTNRSSMFNTLLGAGAQLGGSYLLSDRRLKENIIPMGEHNGIPIYAFNYINIPEKTYLGVMAQDIMEIMPEAVIETEGYMAVNYPMIGIEMRELTAHAA